MVSGLQHRDFVVARSIIVPVFVVDPARPVPDNFTLSGSGLPILAVERITLNFSDQPRSDGPFCDQRPARNKKSSQASGSKLTLLTPAAGHLPSFIYRLGESRRPALSRATASINRLVLR